jgi:hypothetical protein
MPGPIQPSEEMMIDTFRRVHGVSGEAQLRDFRGRPDHPEFARQCGTQPGRVSVVVHVECVINIRIELWVAQPETPFRSISGNLLSILRTGKSCRVFFSFLPI